MTCGKSECGETSKKMWAVIRAKRTFTNDDLQTLAEAKRANIDRFLQKLKKQDLIKHVKKGCWQLIRDPGPDYRKIDLRSARGYEESPETVLQWRARLMTELSKHVGQPHAIGMGELYFAVFRREWKNRINDTRRLRTLITLLRREGVPICSVSDNSGGGYYLASVGSDLENYCQRITNRGLKILAQAAKLRKVTLPKLLGQLALEGKNG